MGDILLTAHGNEFRSRARQLCYYATSHSHYQLLHRRHVDYCSPVGSLLKVAAAEWRKNSARLIMTRFSSQYYTRGHSMLAWVSGGLMRSAII